MNYNIKSRIWIEDNGTIILGQGRADLLAAIMQTGSLSKAAKSMNMSYKKAWRLLDAMNRSGEKALVTTSVGGKDGGGAVLTPYGKEMLQAFIVIKENNTQFLEAQQEHLPK